MGFIDYDRALDSNDLNSAGPWDVEGVSEVAGVRADNTLSLFTATRLKARMADLFTPSLRSLRAFNSAGAHRSSICLTFEFESRAQAESVASVLRQRGEHVEGVYDYG
jgi:hypothetical protein